MAVVERYTFGSVFVDGVEETSDLVVLPRRILRGWWRASGHRLSPADLAPFAEELPRMLIVGTGASGLMRPDQEALAMLQERGVTVEVMPTAEAVRRYAELDPAQTALAMHLTC